MFRKLIAIVLASFALHAAAAVDANRASQAELESVKGIGPGLSGKIMKAREAGQFKDWTDLVDRVSGIGPGNATRFSQAGLTVAGAAFDGSAAAAAKPAKPTKGSSKDAATAEAKAAAKAQKAAKASPAMN